MYFIVSTALDPIRARLHLFTEILSSLTVRTSCATLAENSPAVRRVDEAPTRLELHNPIHESSAIPTLILLAPEARHANVDQGDAHACALFGVEKYREVERV